MTGALTSVAMMPAMMLPGTVPVAVRRARTLGHAPRFVAAYVAIWAAVGLVVDALDVMPSPLATGIVVIAAGLYELTPVKRAYRERCHAELRSGVAHGAYCLGSTVGLMAMFVALGVMNVGWMVVVTVVVLAQKLLPPRAAIDVPLALAIVALGLTFVL